MKPQSCVICEAADHDFGELIASVGSPLNGIAGEVKRAAFKSLTLWVDHVRVLKSSALAHLETLGDLGTIRATRYVDNVLKADGGPTLLTSPILKSNRSAQNQVIAAA